MMGLAHAGTVVRSGDPLKVQGMAPSGIAAQGQMIWRIATSSWELLVHSATIAPITTSAPLDTTGANLIVVILLGFTVGGPSAVQDSQGNTYLSGVMSGGPLNALTEIMYCINPQTNSAHTLTFSGRLYTSFVLLAFKGPSAITVDMTGTAITTNGILQLGTLTPSGSTNLIIAGITLGDNGSTATIDSGFLKMETVVTSGATYGGGAAYLAQEGNNTLSPIFTIYGGTAGVASMLSFKSA